MRPVARSGGPSRGSCPQPQSIRSWIAASDNSLLTFEQRSSFLGFHLVVSAFVIMLASVGSAHPEQDGRSHPRAAFCFDFGSRLTAGWGASVAGKLWSGAEESGKVGPRHARLQTAHSRVSAVPVVPQLAIGIRPWRCCLVQALRRLRYQRWRRGGAERR
jgi:hypothetical protein